MKKQILQVKKLQKIVERIDKICKDYLKKSLSIQKEWAKLTNKK